MKVSIQKFVHGGQALAESEGKKIFVWNALPGEEVDIELTKRKKEYCTGIAEKIITSSSYRIAPCEDHFLSCSPWQIMDFAYENEWKGKIAQETFERFAKLTLPNTAVISDGIEYGYRNKMEYSFWEDEKSEKLSLAFFKRGEKFRYPIESCALAHPAVNRGACEILAWLNSTSATRHDVKSLVMRSNQQGQTVAALFVKNRALPLPQTPFSDVDGILVYFSNPKTPAARPDSLLYTQGNVALVENLVGKELSYGVLSFFQINVPVFEKALERIREFVKDEFVVDFYCGVGAISIALSDSVQGASLIESDAEAVKYAQENIRKNECKNFTVQSGVSEKFLDEIQKDRVIIMDPPRSGLHPKLVKRLCEVQPKRIVYLSCDIATQARDVALLLPHYQLISNELYNFFPRTPHSESLCVMEK